MQRQDLDKRRQLGALAQSRPCSVDLDNKLLRLRLHSAQPHLRLARPLRLSLVHSALLGPLLAHLRRCRSASLRSAHL
jgi:hypothetical protein